MASGLFCPKLSSLWPLLSLTRWPLASEITECCGWFCSPKAECLWDWSFPIDKTTLYQASGGLNPLRSQVWSGLKVFGGRKKSKYPFPPKNNNKQNKQQTLSFMMLFWCLMGLLLLVIAMLTDPVGFLNASWLSGSGEGCYHSWKNSPSVGGM